MSEKTADHAAAMADVEKRLAAFSKAADVWAQRNDAEIDDDLAARANDFITGLLKLRSEADAARKAEKQFWLDGGRDVDNRWAPLITRALRLADVVKPLLAAHLRKKEAAARVAREAAEKRQREEEEAARAAEIDAASKRRASDRIAAQERADEHRVAADAAAAEAAALAGPVRAESTTGMANRRGLRTVLLPSITSLPQALAYYRSEAEVRALIERLAARDLRDAPTIRGVKQVPQIPGIAWIEEKKI